jgi:hypothetical protein
MKLSARYAAVLVACAVAVSGLAVSSPAEAAAKPGVVIDYLRTPVQVRVKPKEIQLFKDLYYTHIRWTTLTSKTGYAFADREVNTCDPSCAEANYIVTKVRLRFTRVRTTSTHRRVFTRVKVTTLAGRKIDSHALPLRGY